MNKFANFGVVLGVATLLISGCQESTTTGPATTTDRSGTPAVKKLSVMAAQDQSIEQGETDKVLVTINRDNFNDPVTIRLNDLPAGVVSVPNEAVIESGSSSTTFELKAGDAAPVGEHAVKITANASGIAENVQTFKLKVKEKG